MYCRILNCSGALATLDGYLRTATRRSLPQWQERVRIGGTAQQMPGGCSKARGGTIVAEARP